MAVRSIIDIAVNDGAFKAFAALYQRYQQTLPATVNSWQQANSRISSVVSGMRTMQATSAAVASSWRSLSTFTSNVASSLKSATDSLLRWTSITSVISGLAGVGSLFGLEHLARGVGAGRREAEGVGTTYGQQRAFELTYGRFFDPGVLGRVSEAISNPANRWALGRLGATREALSRGDSVEVARQILPALKKFVDKAPDEGNLETLRTALGIGKFFSLEDLKRLRRSRGGEFEELGAGFGGLASKFTRTQAQERAFQDFDKALSVSAENIRNAFIVGLAPAIPSLTKLSETVSDLLTALLKDAITPQRVTAWGDSIAAFTKEIGAPEFQEKVHEFVKGVGDMADSINKFFSGGGKIIKGIKYLANTTPLQAAKDLGEAILPQTVREDWTDPARLGLTGEYKKYKQRMRPLTAGYTTFTTDIGGRSPEFSQYDRQEKVFVANNSHNALWLMVQAPNGGSTPRGAAQLGAGFGNFSGVAPFPGG